MTSLKRRGHRSTSVTSSNAPSRAEDTFTEEDEEEEDDPLASSGREGATTRRDLRPPDRIPQSPTVEEHEDEDEEDSGDSESGNRARQRALKILKARNEMPAAGKFLTLARRFS